MRPRLPFTAPSTPADQSARRVRRDRRAERQLHAQLADRPRHVRDELLEMVSRAG